MIDFKGYLFPKEIVLFAMHLYLAYPLSYTMVEEMLMDRGIKVDRSMIQRWVAKYSKALFEGFRKNKRPVGKWIYLYPAVDKVGHTIDCLL